MAVEVESTSQFDEFKRLLRRRAWTILLPGLLISAFGISVAVLVPKKYVSTTRVMLRDLEVAGGGSGGTSEGRVAEHTIRSPQRVRAVLQDLNWLEYASLGNTERVQYVEKTLDNLTVETPPMDRLATQQLVRAEFAHVDARRAQEFLRELMDRWRMEVLERRQSQVRQAYADLKDAREEISGVLRGIGEEISLLRQTHGIYPGSTGTEGRDDAQAPQFVRLDEARAELEAMSDEVFKLEEALARLEAERDRMEDEVPFVTRSEAEDLTQQLAAVDAKIAELEARILTEGWLPAHSRYRAVQGEIARLREQRDSLVASQSAPYEDRLMVPNDAKLAKAAQAEEARRALEASESARQGMADRVAAMELEVRELQDAFVQIAGLLDEQERKNAVLETTETRLEALRQELVQLDSPLADPFEVQDPASLPVSPTEPNPWLIGLFSVLAGFAIGTGTALGKEFSGTSFRSPGDIARTMAVPVLGTVNLIVTRSQARRRAAARVTVGGISAAAVLFVGYVTWAWVNNQSLLSGEVLRVIEEFRSAFE